MIIWRGLGFLVAVISIAAGLLTIGASVLVAGLFYPGDPYASDLFQYFNSQIFALFWLLAGVLAAPALWFLGWYLNRENNHHTMFFIPFQWWAPIVGLLALSGGIFTFFTSGLDRANYSFVQACVKHEQDATQQSCDCIADKIEAGSDPKIFIPFYAEAKDAWTSRTREEEDVVATFAEKYLVSADPVKAEAFLTAFDDAVSCFDTVP